MRTHHDSIQHDSTITSAKGGNSMSGNQRTGRRRRRTTIGAVVTVLACGGAAALVPMGATTQALSTNEQGMVCEWGTLDTPTSTRSFTVTANDGWTSEPDGNAIYDWSYTSTGSFQLPGPVLCANTGEHVVVHLQNDLPVATSIQFPGQHGVRYAYSNPAADGPVGPVADAAGALQSLVQDAAPGGAVSYDFTADREGTYLYQSGTDPELQVQMGLFGALVVYPSGVTISAADVQAIPVDGGGTNGSAGLGGAEAQIVAANDAACAYRSVDDPSKCDPFAIFEKDRENILMLSEVDPGLHAFMEQASQDGRVADMHSGVYPHGYEAHYFMINGRSMPDTIAPNFAPWLPAQPYGSMAVVEPWDPSYNPLDAFIRYIGVGTAGYDFHPHSNHERVIAEDGALMKAAAVAATDTTPATPTADNTEEKFNILVGAGSTVDATFRWTNEEGYSDSNGHRVPVQWPQSLNLQEGDFWSGSPYLGDSGRLNPGILSKTQCGEYYHVAHNHDLTQVTNYGITFGGMLTLIKVEPPRTSIDAQSPCNG